MSYPIPYTSPLTLYGNTKYKGTLVMAEPITLEESNVLEAAYDAAREAALAGKQAGVEPLCPEPTVQSTARGCRVVAISFSSSCSMRAGRSFFCINHTVEESHG